MSASLKYTLSKKRKKWVQMVHPGLLELVNILQDIPWNEYYYEGSSLVEFSGNSTAQKTVQMKAKTPTYPYMLFGGICYNILHKEYKGTNMLIPSIFAPRHKISSGSTSRLDLP